MPIASKALPMTSYMDIHPIANHQIDLLLEAMHSSPFGAFTNNIP
jgi:hypothetical protein